MIHLPQPPKVLELQVSLSPVLLSLAHLCLKQVGGLGEEGELGNDMLLKRSPIPKGTKPRSHISQTSSPAGSQCDPFDKRSGRLKNRESPSGSREPPEECGQSADFGLCPCVLFLPPGTPEQLRCLSNEGPTPSWPSMGVWLCCPGWSAVAQSQLTATSTSRVQAILPQPPEYLGLQENATAPG
ncbi:hypothetical protein AAY473_035171 [Plecturocebus cupreus]